MTRLLVVLFLGFSLLGCVALNKVEVESDDPVVGIKAIAASGKPVSVLFVHGMGVHPKGYSDDLRRGITVRLGVATAQSSDFPITRGGITVGYLRIHEGIILETSKPIRFVELTWSPLTTQAKLTMLKLDPGTYKEDNVHEDKRVWLNSGAKAFVNEKFSDAVLYSGRLKPTFNDIVAEAICALTAAHAPVNSIQNCFSNTKRINESHEIVLFSESLGSALVFDTLYNLSHQYGPRQETAFLTVANMRHIFLLANQLPLIEMTEIIGPVSQDWLGNFPCPNPATTKKGIQSDHAYIRPENTCYASARERCDAESSDLRGIAALLDIRQRAIPESKIDDPVPPLRFTALSDPNDVLTYWLTDRFKQRCGATRNVQFTNVTVRNARFFWGFVLANPMSAHTGFEENNKVIDFIVNGN